MPTSKKKSNKIVNKNRKKSGKENLKMEKNLQYHKGAGWFSSAWTSASEKEDKEEIITVEFNYENGETSKVEVHPSDNIYAAAAAAFPNEDGVVENIDFGGEEISEGDVFDGHGIEDGDSLTVSSRRKKSGEDYLEISNKKINYLNQYVRKVFWTKITPKDIVKKIYVPITSIIYDALSERELTEEELKKAKDIIKYINTEKLFDTEKTGFNIFVKYFIELQAVWRFLVGTPKPNEQELMNFLAGVPRHDVRQELVEHVKKEGLNLEDYPLTPKMVEYLNIIEESLIAEMITVSFSKYGGDDRRKVRVNPSDDIYKTVYSVYKLGKRPDEGPAKNIVWIYFEEDKDDSLDKVAWNDVFEDYENNREGEKKFIVEIWDMKMMSPLPWEKHPNLGEPWLAAASPLYGIRGAPEPLPSFSPVLPKSERRKKEEEERNEMARTYQMAREASKRSEKTKGGRVLKKTQKGARNKRRKNNSRKQKKNNKS